jgi:hypothetical protein
LKDHERIANRFLEDALIYLFEGLPKPKNTPASGIIKKLGLVVDYTHFGDRIEINLIDLQENDELHKSRLLGDIARQLDERLREKGVSKANATQISRAVSDTFNDATAFATPAQREAAVNLALAASLAALSIRETSKKWKDRAPEEHPTAEAFLRDVYKGRLGIDGNLSITALKRVDRELADQLLVEFEGRREELDALLPNRRMRGDAKLMRELGHIPPDERERQNALAVISRGGQPGARGPYRRSATPKS